MLAAFQGFTAKHGGKKTRNNVQVILELIHSVQKKSSHKRLQGQERA